MPNFPGSGQWSRRHFLQATVGATLTGAACSSLGLDEEEEPILFDGPQIEEEDFITLNARYYDIGLDARTGFPFSAVLDGTPLRETDPVSIAYRLQYLVDMPHASTAVDKLLSSLLEVQISERPPRNYRNMIPRLDLGETPAKPNSTSYSFTDNALLSSRVAMAAQAFKGTATGDKAQAFLDRQKLGYNQALNGSQSGFLPEFGDSTLFGVDPQGLDLLFGGYYESVAFVLAYFIGDTPIIQDPQRGIQSWLAMIQAQYAYSDQFQATTVRDTTLNSPLARNGSAFQFFHSLLGVQTEYMAPSMLGGLYNALFSYLDAATFDRLPGIYSASPHEAGFLLDNGLNRLSARQRRHPTQELFVTIDALAAAMRLFPKDSDARQILRGWIGLYGSVKDAVGQHGYYGAINKDGAPIKALYARQNGAMILIDSKAPSLLEAFLTENGRPGMCELIGQIGLSHDGDPIQPVPASLPLPLRFERLFTPRR